MKGMKLTPPSNDFILLFPNFQTFNSLRYKVHIIMAGPLSK